MAKTPLQSYGSKALETEKKSRLADITKAYAAQRTGLDVAQQQQKEQLGQNINRFAAVNRLDPNSTALLKFRTDTENKAAQEFAAQQVGIGGKEAETRQALAGEIGQRRLAEEESNFNRAIAVFQAGVAAHAEGIKSSDDWGRLMGGKNGFLTRLFGGQGFNVPQTKGSYNPGYANQPRALTGLDALMAQSQPGYRGRA
jgi:hypothetical protein